MRKIFVILFALFLPLSAHATPCGNEYTKLEYIESTGTQYIDTGIPVNNYNSFETSIALVSKELETVYGYIVSQGTNSLRHSENAVIWFTVHSNYRFYPTYNLFNVYEFGYDYMNVNGVPLSPTTDTDNASGTNVYLFAHNDLHEFATVKMAYIKILDQNQQMVFYGIPVRRNSDGVSGMCDTISGNFFTNGGSGEFIAGPVVCDVGYGRTPNNTCEQLCTAGITELHTGTGLVFNIYANKNTSPAIHIKPDGQNTVCYVNLASGAGNNAINVRYNGVVYHTTN